MRPWAYRLLAVSSMANESQKDEDALDLDRPEVFLKHSWVVRWNVIPSAQFSALSAFSA